MGYFVLWLEQLVFCSLLIAVGIALAARCRVAWQRGVVARLWLAAPVLFWAAAAVLATWVERGLLRYKINTGLVVPLWILAGAVLAIGLILYSRGLILRGEDDGPAARSWSLPWLSLSLAMLLAAHAVTLWNLDQAVRQQLVAQRAEASSLALANAPPRVVDRENAGLLYIQAFEGGLKSATEGSDWLDDKGNPKANLQQDEKYLAFVRHNAPLLRIVRQATTLPGCHFSRDWGRPSLDMHLEEVQDLRTAARGLKYEAHYLAAQGDIRGALANVLAMHRLAEHAGQEPILISLLVSIALDATALQTLEQLLLEHAVTADDLAALEGWQPTSNLPRMQRAMRLEEAFGLATFAQLGDDPLVMDQFEPGTSPFFGLGYRVFLLPNDVASYRRLMGEWQKQTYSSLRNVDGFAKRQDELFKNGKTGPLTAMLFPALQQVHKATVRADAQQRLMYLAIAMHRHRLLQGTFPESLEELTKGGEVYLPPDPFVTVPLGKTPTETLRLVRRDDRVVLYSVGPDQKDDQGTPFNAQTRAGDMTFELRAK